MPLYNSSVERRLVVLLFGLGKSIRQKIQESKDYLTPMPDLEMELDVFRNLAYVYGHTDEEIDEFCKMVSHRSDDDFVGMERTMEMFIQNLLDD